MSNQLPGYPTLYGLPMTTGRLANDIALTSSVDKGTVSA